MSTFELHIPSIVCPACAEPIEKVLKECPEVENVSVNTIKQIAYVAVNETSSIPEATILNNLRKATGDIGYPVGEIGISTLSYWVKGLIGVIAGLAILGLSIFGMGIPLIAMYLIGGISSLLTLFLGKQTYKHAFITLIKTKKFSMETLFTVSTLLAIGISCAAFFVSWLPMMFDTALLILGFKNIGQAIQESAKQKITKQTFCSLAPKKIALQNSNKEIDVKDLKKDDVIVVRAGQMVPVNGICLTENASTYNTIFDGKTLPQPVEKNQLIYAGAVVPKGAPDIIIKVTAAEEKSYLALADRRADAAQAAKGQIETSAKNILQYFIPAVFAIAVISASIVAVLLSPIAAIQCGIAVLASACPCGIGVITPLAMSTAITKASALGISFKSGSAVEAAARVNAVVFDIHGTLTSGKPRVIRTNLSKKLLAILAKIEQKSNHPIAKALCDYANEQACSPIDDSVEFPDQTLNHSGIVAKINDDEFIIGNSQMMEDYKVEYEAVASDAEHVIYFARNKKIIGHVLLEEPLNPDVMPMLQALRNQGKKIYLCTGADKDTANKYAYKLGILRSNVQANCIAASEDANANTKTNYIQKLIDRGWCVAMVGDAGNDAAAVANSHFGIAVESIVNDEVAAIGRKQTQEQAGATINQNSLNSIVHGFIVAQQAITNIKQNLAISIGYNVLAMVAFSGLLVAVGFALNPALGALLMIVQTGLILMNVARFRLQSVPTVPTAPAHNNIAPTDNSLYRQFGCKHEQAVRSEPEAKLSTRRTSVSSSGSFRRKNSVDDSPNTVPQHFSRSAVAP